MLEPLLKGVFAALEQADIWAACCAREHLQAAISELRKARQMGLGTPEEMDLQSAIEAVAQSDQRTRRRCCSIALPAALPSRRGGG